MMAPIRSNLPFPSFPTKSIEQDSVYYILYFLFHFVYLYYISLTLYYQPVYLDVYQLYCDWRQAFFTFTLIWSLVAPLPGAIYPICDPSFPISMTYPLLHQPLLDLNWCREGLNSCTTPIYDCYTCRDRDCLRPLIKKWNHYLYKNKKIFIIILIPLLNGVAVLKKIYNLFIK